MLSGVELSDGYARGHYLHQKPRLGMCQNLGRLVSVVSDGLSKRAAIAGGGINAFRKTPGSDFRSVFWTIFGSVPTATTGVTQAWPTLGDTFSAWHPPQCISYSGLPFSASCSSRPNASIGQGGGVRIATFSSS